MAIKRSFYQIIRFFKKIISLPFEFSSHVHQALKKHLLYRQGRLVAAGLAVPLLIVFSAGLFFPDPAWAGKLRPEKVVLVTDLHFNPFADPNLASRLAEKPYWEWDRVFSESTVTALPAYNQETNPVLFDLVLKAMKKKARKSSAVLFTGDILAHDFDAMIVEYTGATSRYERNRFIYKTMAYVSMKLDKCFHGAPIYFSLGNNDAYSGDYALTDDGEFLHTTADLFYRNFIKSKEDRAGFYSTYPVHGYYSISFKAVKQGRIIGLNTIFFSTNYPSAGPGNAELDWLARELEKAKKAGEVVWLLLHIPPGVNVYSTQRNSTAQSVNVTLQWQSSHNERYLELIRQYGDTIAASFAGHTHMDDFRLIYDSDAEDKKAIDFIHITPAVTPVFGNNPAFQIITVNPQSGTPQETTTYYLDLKNKAAAFDKEYVYTTAYNTTPDLKGLSVLYPVLSTDPVKRDAYTGYYYVSSTAASIAGVWQWYWCGIGSLTADEYIRAYRQLQQKPTEKAGDNQ